MVHEIVSFPPTAETKRSIGNLVRNSTGHLNSSNIGEKVLPHYLRASTGSCHDFCKYGKKHAVEATARLPLRRRTTTLAHRPSGQYTVDEEISAKIKQSTSCKLKPPADTRRPSAEFPELLKRDTFTPSNSLEVSTNQASLNANRTELSPKPRTVSKPKHVKAKPVSFTGPSGSSTDVRNSSNLKRVKVGTMNRDAVKGKEMKMLRRHNTPSQLQPVTVKASSSVNPVGGANGRRNSNIKTAKNVGTSKVAGKRLLVPPKASMSPKGSLIRVPSLNARKQRRLKVVPDEIWKKDEKKVEAEEPSHEDVQEKTLYVTKIETQIKIAASVENNSPIIQSSLSSLGTSESVESNCPIIETSPLSPSSSPKSLSSPRSSSMLSYLKENSEESEYTLSDENKCILENHETAALNNTETFEDGECKSRLREAVVISSGDDDHDPKKLKFRRGKVVDLESENTGSKKLKFRRGKVMGENDKDEIRRRHFKKREAVGDDIKNIADDAEKVILRHQDVQGNKNAQGLFNNVIEETVSQLVKTRKSKVKALVGAFETVISLQERKPSTAAAS